MESLAPSATIHTQQGAKYILIVAMLWVWLPCSHTQCYHVTILGQKTAECNDKELTDIPKGMDRDVKVLKFGKNKLTKLDIDAFKDYLAIQELYLQNNQISSIAPDAFRGLLNLQILELEANNLDAIPILSFQHLRALKVLSLKTNPIKYITEHAFDSLPMIQEFDFENCYLDRIHPKAFSGLDQLTEINVVNNEISSLNSEMEEFLPESLKIFRLYRNPWKCDCKLRWLRDWISASKINWDFARNTPACSLPEIIRGVNWRYLKPNQFACPSRILANSTTSMELEVGNNLTLQCTVVGDPKPVITWLKGSESIIGLTELKGKRITFDEKLEGNQIVSIITLWEVVTRHAGDYKCIAENTAGRSEVTYKIWIKGIDPKPPDSKTVMVGLGKDVVIGIAVGGAILFLILLACIAYFIWIKDRKRHEYKVRDYKKEAKGKKDKRNNHITDNYSYDKSGPTVTTELLSEKETERDNHIREKEKEMLAVIEKDQDKKNEQHKTLEKRQLLEEEKEKEKQKIEKTEALMSTATLMMNDANDTKAEEFKMKLFSYTDPHADCRTHLDLGVGTPEEDGRVMDPLFQNSEKNRKPTCNNVRGGTPDLLQNNHKCQGSQDGHSPNSDKSSEDSLKKSHRSHPSGSGKPSLRENKTGCKQTPIHKNHDAMTVGSRTLPRIPTGDTKPERLSGSKGHLSADELDSPVGSQSHLGSSTTQLSNHAPQSQHIPNSQSLTGELDQLSNSSPSRYGDRSPDGYKTLPNPKTGAKSAFKHANHSPLHKHYGDPSTPTKLGSATTGRSGKHQVRFLPSPPKVHKQYAPAAVVGLDEVYPPKPTIGVSKHNLYGSRYAPAHYSTIPAISGSHDRNAITPPMKPPRAFSTNSIDNLSDPALTSDRKGVEGIKVQKHEELEPMPEIGHTDEYGTVV